VGLGAGVARSGLMGRAPGNKKKPGRKKRGTLAGFRGAGFAHGGKYHLTTLRHDKTEKKKITAG